MKTTTAERLPATLGLTAQGGADGVLAVWQQGLWAVLLDVLGLDSLNHSGGLFGRNHEDADAAVAATHAIDHLEGRVRLGRLEHPGPRLDELVAADQEGVQQARLAVKTGRVGTRVRVPVKTPRLCLHACAELGPPSSRECVAAKGRRGDASIDNEG